MKKKILKLASIPIVALVLLVNINLSHINENSASVTLSFLNNSVAQSENGGSPCNCRCTFNSTNICYMFDCCIGCLGTQVWCT